MSAITDFLSALDTHFPAAFFPVAEKLIEDGEHLPVDRGGSLHDTAGGAGRCVGPGAATGDNALLNARRRSLCVFGGTESRFACGAHRGAMVSLLDGADFIPDVVVIFCNSRDAMPLVAAAAWVSGAPPGGALAARGVCCDGIVQAVLGGETVVAVARGPDCQGSGTGDDELT